MAAAKGGAVTTSVDLASRSLEKTTENFTINNIDYTKHDIIVEDIFLYFKRAKKEELKFDVVILDPPVLQHLKIIDLVQQKIIRI